MVRRDVRRKAMEKLEWIADTYLSVGAPVQCAAPKLLALAEEFRDVIGDRTVQFALRPGIADGLRRGHSWMWKADGMRPSDMPHVRTEEEYALDLLERAGTCWFSRVTSTISKAKPI